MQHCSWLTVSLLSLCFSGAVCWRFQEYAEKTAVVNHRSGTTDSQSTAASSQNSSTGDSGIHHVTTREISKSGQVKQTLPQRGPGLYTRQGTGLAVSQPGRLTAGQVTSDSTPVEDNTPVDLGSDLKKAVSQKEDFISSTSASDDTIWSIYRSKGLISKVSDSGGFTSPSSAGEGFTSIPTKSEDSKLLWQRGKHLKSPIPRREFVTTPIHEGVKLTSQPQEIDTLILRTTGSENLKLRKSQNIDFVNEVPGYNEWMNSTLNDESKKDEDFMHAGHQNGDAMKKTARNSEQEMHKSKYIEQTTPHDYGWNNYVPENEDADVKDRLKTTIQRSDNLTRWESEDGMSEEGQSEYRTPFTTDKTRVAGFTGYITHTEIQKVSLLHTTQQDGGLFRTTIKNTDLISIAGSGEGTTDTISNGAHTKDRNEKGRKHGRWKEYGDSVIDNRAMTTDEYVNTTHQGVQIVHTTQIDGHFMDTSRQDGEHGETASQHAKLNHSIQDAGNFESSKQHEEESTFTTQQSDNTAAQQREYKATQQSHEFTSVDNTQSVLHTNNSTHNQYIPSLTESETDNYLTYQIHYEMSTLPNMPGDNEHTTVQDNDMTYGTTEAGTSFRAAETSNELKYTTTVKTEMAKTSEQRTSQQQQTANTDQMKTSEQPRLWGQQTNVDNSQHTTDNNITEAQEFSNDNDVINKDGTWTSQQSMQNRDLKDNIKEEHEKNINKVSEELTESTSSSPFATHSKDLSSYQWRTNDIQSVPINQSVYSNVTMDVPEYNMAASMAPPTDGTPRSRDIAEFIRSANLNGTNELQDNTERNTGPVTRRGQTANPMSTAKHNLGQITSTKGRNLAITSTILTGSEKSYARMLRNNIAVATTLQDSTHSSTPETPSKTAEGAHRLTDQVASITRLPIHKEDSTTQLLTSNLATSTAASETYTIPATNTTQLAYITPDIKFDDVANNATQMKANRPYTTQTLKDTTDITLKVNGSEYSLPFGPIESLVTVTTTANMDATAGLSDVGRVRTTSGLDIYRNTTAAEGGVASHPVPVTERGVDKGLTELEPGTTTAIGATEKVMVNTATKRDAAKTITERGVVDTSVSERGVVNTAIAERGVMNTARIDTDKLWYTTSLNDDYQDNGAKKPEDAVHTSTDDMQDKLDATTLSKNDYVDNGSPQVEGDTATHTPPLDAKVSSVTPPSWGSITSNDTLHPQTTASQTKSETNITKQTKTNQQHERPNSEDVRHLGEATSSQESGADLMDADQPGTTLSNTQLPDLTSADEDTSEPLPESTKPDSVSNSQSSPVNAISRSVFGNKDSKEANTEPGMPKLPSGHFHWENMNTLPWGKTRNDQENPTHKPRQNQTERHTRGADQQTTSQGSEYLHSHAQEISLDKDKRPTNSGQHTGSSETTKESLYHKETTIRLSDSVSVDEKEQEPSIDDSYLTSQKYLLRNTKTLPELNTGTVNSLKKTTETASDIFQQETNKKTGKASNPLVTPSRDLLDDPSECPACNRTSTIVKDAETKEVMIGDPSRDLSVSSVAADDFQTPSQISSPTTTFSWTSAKPSAPTRAPNNNNNNNNNNSNNKHTHVTPTLPARNTRISSDSHFRSTISTVPTMDQTTTSTKVAITTTTSASKAALISSTDPHKISTFTAVPSSTDPDKVSTFTAVPSSSDPDKISTFTAVPSSTDPHKISTFTADPSPNVDSTSPLSPSKKSHTSAQSTSIASFPRSSTSTFESRTSPPASAFSFNSFLSTFRSFPVSFSDKNQPTTTRISSSRTDATPSTESSVDASLSTVTRPPFVKESTAQTFVTSRTTRYTPSAQLNPETNKLTRTARPLTTTTREAESTSHTGTSTITQTSTDRDDQMQTSTFPLTLASTEKTSQATFSRRLQTTYSTTATLSVTETQSASTTTPRDTTSTTSMAAKTTKVDKQTHTTTPTTVTPSPRPKTTTATTTTTTATTTRQTEMTSTREPTTTSPLQLGDVCAAPPSPDADTCTAGVLYSVCRGGRCGCAWPRHADHGRCVQYSLTNPGIQVSHVTETAITIKWSSQTFSGVRSVMYKVSWESRGRSAAGGVPGSSRITTDPVYVIDQLTPGTEYVVSVTAVVVDQENELNRLDLYFAPAAGTTVPSQVGKMNWSLSSDKNTATLTFDRPLGRYDHCKVVVRHMTRDGTVDSSDPIRRFDCLTFNLSPFEVGIWYTIDVTVINGNLAGQMSTFNLTTPAAAPGLVTRASWKTTDHSALVTWLPPQQRHGYISGYELTLYTDGACVQHVLILASIKHNQTPGKHRSGVESQDDGNSRDCGSSKLVETLLDSRNESLTFTFTDLRPGRQYTLELFAQNGKLNGEVTRISMTTLSAVPRPPSDVRVEEVTSNSILVSWTPPEYPGPTNYVISVFKNRFKDDVKFVRNTTVVGYNTSSVRLSDLQHYSTYWLNVSAATSAGESRPTIVGPIATLQKVSDPVSRLKVHEITAYSVSLVWGHPRNVFGHLSAYIIFVQPESSPGNCERVVILSEKKAFRVNQTVCSPQKVVHVHLMTLLHLTSISFSVTDLQPYTAYSVSVAAVNGAGLGRVSTVTLSTDIAVPPAPLGLKCTTASRGSITFTWDAPALTAGPTTYFILVSQSKHMSDLSQGLEFFGNFTVPESSNRSLNLSGLKDFWLYRISMLSQTAAGSSQLVILDPPCRTPSAPPGPVRDLQIVSVNATSARLLWQCPREDDRHGVIERFVIVQRVQMLKRFDLDVDSDVAETLTLKARPQSCSRTYNVTVKVIPEVTYIFQVQAKVVSIELPGDPLSQVFTAPAEVPKPIVTLPTSEPYTDESSLKKSSFSVSVCVSCLLDNSHGQISAFGILVCQEGFCDQTLGDLHDWKSVYSRMATWKSAHSKQFETVYRATDRSWELQLQNSLARGQTNEVIFEVGNDTSCADKPGNVYCNGPLPDGTSFRVRLFSCTAAGCSVSDPSGLFMTAESDSQPSSDSVVIGGAVAGIAVAAVVLAVVIGVRLKFRDPKIKERSSKGGSQEMTQVVVVTSVPSAISSHTSRPIRIGDYDKMLRALHMNDNAALSQEYAELNQKSPQHPVEVGSDLAFRHDNRWTNILPFDHSRVKLAVLPGDESCAHDYINANYVSGLDSSREYIATQGPLTRTVPDFWRMVWEQNVSVIVMLSNFEELDKRTQIMREKVARYFPSDEESGSCQYGLIQVSRTRKDYNNKWEIRTLKLSHVRARKVRILKHFFFKNWSDHEADIDTRELIDFVEVLRAEIKSLPRAPMVVHCSAGVGRTGTFIAVHYFYKLLSSMRSTSDTPGLGAAANKTVDIFGRVLKLRDCRRFMVQSMSQYIFVYDAVQEIIRRVFQLERSTDYGFCDKKENQPLNILTCPGLLEDTVYDDVELLQGHVTVDRCCETPTA